jgi:hypothetical protein
MLSCTVSPLQRSLFVQQQHLIFPDIPCPHENLWAQLNSTQREAVIEVLARLITQTAHPDTRREENIDD